MKHLYGLFLLAALVLITGEFADNTYQNQLVSLMLQAEEDQNSKPLTYSMPTEMTACYGAFGCFNQEPIGMLPENPEELNPKFRLYINARMGSKKAVKVYKFNMNVGNEDELTQKSLRNITKKLVFVAHGFGGSANLSWLREIKEAKTKLYADNVIIVDWSKGARTSTLYIGAAANTFLIGRMIAILGMKLVKKYEIPIANLEIIGFSLGAQIAGFFAREIFERSGEKIGKITALDCAAPLFEKYGIRPSKKHTHFLEAVHTAAGNILWRGKVGVGESYGHVDFYPNGGIDQPGCGVLEIACAHNRAVEYYVEAVANNSSCRYQGFLCNTVEQASQGECETHLHARPFISTNHSTTSEAIIYLKTGDSKPFCVNHLDSEKPVSEEVSTQIAEQLSNISTATERDGV